jgi:hypothetical protein
MARNENHLLSAAPTERRTGADRRKRDIAPPAGWERRRNVDPRMPEVTELELTDSQWAVLHGSTFSQ